VRTCRPLGLKATHLSPPSLVGNRPISLLDETSHRRATPSAPAVRRDFESGLNARPSTPLGCSNPLLIALPLAASQSWVTRVDRTAIIRPSGLKATAVIGPGCSSGLPISFPLGTSQRRAVRSVLPVSNVLPSGLKVRAWMTLGATVGG